MGTNIAVGGEIITKTKNMLELLKYAKVMLSSVLIELVSFIKYVPYDETNSKEFYLYTIQCLRKAVQIRGLKLGQKKHGFCTMT